MENKYYPLAVDLVCCKARLLIHIVVHVHFLTDHNFDLVHSEFDLHVLTGALKMFFRELKEPLFPFDMFDKFMGAISK